MNTMRASGVRPTAGMAAAFFLAAVQTLAYASTHPPTQNDAQKRARRCPASHEFYPAPSRAGVMTSELIKEASDAGARLTRFDDSKLKMGRSMGLVLTPSRRMAAATRVVRSGRSFMGTELPPAFLENLWWVMAYPETLRESRPFIDYAMVTYPDRVSEIMIRTSSLPVYPVRTMSIVGDCEVAILSFMFGGRVRQGSMIAAFPADAFQSGNEIIVSYTSARSKLHKITRKQVRDRR